MIARALTWKKYQADRRRFSKYIQAALNKGSDTSLHTLEGEIKHGCAMPLGLYEDNELIGLIVAQLNKTDVHICTVSGRFKDGWLNEVIPFLEGLAISQDRIQITGRGRKGWQRKLAPLGFTYEGDKYIKVIA